MMICELRIDANSTITTTSCNSLEETITLMSDEFSKANNCSIEESRTVLNGVIPIIEALPENEEFTAWEIEDHDNNNEIVKCIIRKISN
jgi:hypothetical protein